VNKRRSLIATGLALLGFDRRAWAQLADPSAPIRYASLIRPVKTPVDTPRELATSGGSKIMKVVLCFT